MRITIKRVLGLGVLAAAGYALWRAFEQQNTASGTSWEAQPFPFPPCPTVDASTPWVDAGDDGACPAHHPVKAKLASGIFHVPGGANYERTRADRCYLSVRTAEDDGLRQSKR